MDLVGHGHSFVSQDGISGRFVRFVFSLNKYSNKWISFRSSEENDRKSSDDLDNFNSTKIEPDKPKTAKELGEFF